MPSKGRNKSKGKRRDKRCKPRGTDSKGLRRHKKHPLSPVQRALLGKGRVQAFHAVTAKYGWRGATVLSMEKPWDPVQAEENKRLYPHLFVDEEPRGRKAA